MTEEAPKFIRLVIVIGVSYIASFLPTKSSSIQERAKTYFTLMSGRLLVLSILQPSIRIFWRSVFPTKLVRIHDGHSSTLRIESFSISARFPVLLCEILPSSFYGRACSYLTVLTYAVALGRLLIRWKLVRTEDEMNTGMFT